jgi:hypothetical protein
MTPLKTDVWKRKGFSLLWSSEALAALAPPNEVVSLRQFFAMARNWQDGHLKSNNGNALVVAGLEGCLDLLSPDDAAPWIEQRVLPRVLSFQGTFESDAALLFWLPTGKSRIKQNAANESYTWHCSGSHARETTELGRILWGGSELDAIRILDPTTRSQDPDGPAWIGIYLPRLS